MNRKKLLIAGVGLLLVLSVFKLEPYDVEKEIVKSSVMITNTTGTAGGSGVVLKSTPMVSYVLTNRHVCKLIDKDGGLLSTYDGRSFYVTQVIEGKYHDICLITVLSDLEANTKIAGHRPDFQSKTLVSGHPTLLPTLITKGNFLGVKVIEVVDHVDSSCTTWPFCQVDSSVYESYVFSNLISPGSSGSGVFNESGELIALIFAGSGNLAPGMAVPLESIHAFILNESGNPGLL
jgi:S1-C subfamily serine protease